MYNYCTYFDSNYFTRGIAMYESLKKYTKNFKLFIFAFDNRAYNLLKILNLENVEVIPLEEFENEDLKRVKPNRSKVEYMWTCTPWVIKYVLENYNVESCTYLDADIYFFGNPEVLIKEMEDKSILLTPHRYTPEYDQTMTSGIFCVQFMTFRNDEYGRTALNWWAKACIDWCYARYEDGKFGDQKYLDDWPDRFKGVHILQNLGGGVAPWNIQQYKLEEKPFELIFYHFHGLRFYSNGLVDLCGSYRIRKEDIRNIYVPYIYHLEEIKQRLKHIDNDYDYHGSLKWKNDLRNIARRLKRRLKGTYNIYTMEDLKRIANEDE
ncbi:MAG: glycosyl transferase [Candidatus Calescibacterium sp.]|nr:glycosyl transferase [Candidatus Calescibacterium sp.]